MVFDIEKARALAKAALEIPPEEKTVRVKAPKSISTRTKNVSGMNKEVVETKSEFEDVRHLVEYLLTKHPKIRYEQSQVIISKHFPGKNYDAGGFTWYKLEMQKTGKAKYHEQIAKQLIDTEKETT